MGNHYASPAAISASLPATPFSRPVLREFLAAKAEFTGATSAIRARFSALTLESVARLPSWAQILLVDGDGSAMFRPYDELPLSKKENRKSVAAYQPDRRRTLVATDSGDNLRAAFYHEEGHRLDHEGGRSVSTQLSALPAWQNAVKMEVEHQIANGATGPAALDKPYSGYRWLNNHLFGCKYKPDEYASEALAEMFCHLAMFMWRGQSYESAGKRLCALYPFAGKAFLETIVPVAQKTAASLYNAARRQEHGVAQAIGAWQNSDSLDITTEILQQNVSAAMVTLAPDDRALVAGAAKDSGFIHPRHFFAFSPTIIGWIADHFPALTIGNDNDRPFITADFQKVGASRFVQQLVEAHHAADYCRHIDAMRFDVRENLGIDEDAFIKSQIHDALNCGDHLKPDVRDAACKLEEALTGGERAYWLVAAMVRVAELMGCDRIEGFEQALAMQIAAKGEALSPFEKWLDKAQILDDAVYALEKNPLLAGAVKNMDLTPSPKGLETMIGFVSKHMRTPEKPLILAQTARIWPSPSR